jgi:polyphosphate kinase 2 (PPK2 family)
VAPPAWLEEEMAKKNKQEHKQEKNAPESKVAAPEAMNHEPQPSSSTKVKALRLGQDCDYEKELRRLQIELAKLQEWIRHEGLRVVVLFEGRDAAGKGGAIKRITDTQRTRKDPVVFPKIRRPSARGWRNGAL